MGTNQKLLFICSRNKWRSPTAEKIFKNKGYSARSAGTSPHAKRRLSHLDLRWADIIFVMENKHRSQVISKFPRIVENKPLHVLEIPDNYDYMDEELITILEDSVGSFL